MRVLYDAAGRARWVTVTEDNCARFLWLDGCEEGAMNLHSEDPVFDYLWFYKGSAMVGSPLQRALVLGAGSFTAAKCLALDFPDAVIDAIDCEAELVSVGQRFFRLDLPEYARISFEAMPAETFLERPPHKYNFIFDDVFDAFQMVPESCRNILHFQMLHHALKPGGMCVKNMIWTDKVPDTRGACRQAVAALATVFAAQEVLALGESDHGHNLLLLGMTDQPALGWMKVRQHLSRAGVPTGVLDRCRPHRLFADP